MAWTSPAQSATSDGLTDRADELALPPPLQALGLATLSPSELEVESTVHTGPPPSSPPNTSMQLPSQTLPTSTIQCRARYESELPRPTSFQTTGRKRTRDESDFDRERERVSLYDSSDPPLFSSDDLSAGLESYEPRTGGHTRKKTLRRRFWWEEDNRRSKETGKDRLAALTEEGKRPRKPLKRTDDSGVWMNSDEAEEEMSNLVSVSKDLDTCVDSSKGKEAVDRHEEDGKTSSQQSGSGWKTTTPRKPMLQGSRIPIQPEWMPQPRNLDLFHQMQNDAAAHVHAMVEDGLPVVDLSRRNLEILLPSTIEPLHYLTIQIPGPKPPIRWDWRSLRPEISLYLSSNDLSDIPGELYRLTKIENLSLRNNQLSTLSPAIGNLTNLLELNLSTNNFRYLPFEITHAATASIQKLHLQPNPFLRAYSQVLGRAFFEEDRIIYPETQQPDAFARPPVRARRTFPCVKLTAHVCAVSAVSYLDPSGFSCRGSAPAPSSTSQFLNDVRASVTSAGFGSTEVSPSHFPASGSTSRVPSLVELSLRCCARSSNLASLPTLLSPSTTTTSDDLNIPSSSVPNHNEDQDQDQENEPFPAHLLNLLKRVYLDRPAGSKLCTVCEREYIVPRTEWIEWWGRLASSAGSPVPLLRNGCSWQCVPVRESYSMGQINEDGDQSVADEWWGCGWVAADEEN
ncbi:hypothetical protein MMC25_002944 [Agyrium rufum]|nr:hypothetical protein [Agyrium rufum]